jgi:hypothetical protein
MEVNVLNARKQFFGQSALEWVYIEAVANALDAHATEISIDIDITGFTKPESLRVTIKDNGEGFTDQRFEKFSRLLEVDDLKHKGLGRLVYLNYFKRVDVESFFKGKKRTFVFNDSFGGQCEVSPSSTETQGSTLMFMDYYRERVKAYDYLDPNYLKRLLLIQFMPNFLSMKLNKDPIVINISLNTLEEEPIRGFIPKQVSLTLEDLPDLKLHVINTNDLGLFTSVIIHYSIREVNHQTTPLTAICSDNRTIPIDVISPECLPVNKESIFLIESEYFDGKTDNSRRGITLEPYELTTVKRAFRQGINGILQTEIPEINTRNEELLDQLQETYPHLSGYFGEDYVGYAQKMELIEHAQNCFFLDQREVLESSTLDEAKYKKSLELSARLLTEYVLYRTKIIEKIKNIGDSESEATIHNIIVPRFKTYTISDTINDIYSNNAWLLDDKFMSYSTIMSDKEMGELIHAISENDTIKDDTRPDIAIVFSSDPNQNIEVDVVIVELKKKALELAKKEEVISQLRQRARRLLKFYPDKIQRIWFYGIVEFDNEFIRSLKEDKFIELYSKDTCYYKEISIIPDNNDNVMIPIGTFILSYKALIEDAESRNGTFLKILKEGIRLSQMESEDCDNPNM